jgi:hypothetical protein
MDGEFINLYIYDIKKNLTYDQIKSMLRNPEDFSKYEYNTPIPEELPTFTLPQIFNLNNTELQFDGKTFKIKVQVAVYEIGTFSIRVRVPLENVDEQILAKLAFSKELAKSAEQIAEKARKKVEATMSKQFEIKTNLLSEMYSFYFINSTKAQIMKGSKNLIVGLLIDEPNASMLDQVYIDDVLNKSLSYNSDDAFFVGWEGAVLIDKLKGFDYELLMAEIANIQLLKLRIYKEKASKLLKETSMSVEELDKMNFLTRVYSNKANALNQKLSEFSDDLMEMFNRIDNIVFSLGEWYLSRLYGLFANAFRLDELRDAVMLDSNTIARRKSFVNEIIEERRSDILELIVIALIIIEIVVEAAYLLKPV